MQIKTAVLASLPALALAAPTGHSGQNPDAPQTFPSQYGLIIGNNVQPFHFESINANSGKFWLNLPETVSSCPSDIAAQGACPPGNETVFTGAGGLSTVVPGGQQVYVLPTGEIMFTAAHENLIPQGAVSAPFTYSYTEGAQFGVVSTNAFGAVGFMACPTQASIAYQVFADIPGAVVPLGDPSACVPVDPLAVPYTAAYAGAWQYN